MNLIATICRFALKDDPSREVIKAVLKLRDTLQKDGLIVEARALSALVDKADTKKNLTLDNKKITWSKGFLSGKSEMTVSTPLPVDKENSMPLAEVLFPKEINDFQEFHFFDDNITSAIDGILAE